MSGVIPIHVKTRQELAGILRRGSLHVRMLVHTPCCALQRPAIAHGPLLLCSRSTGQHPGTLISRHSRVP